MISLVTSFYNWYDRFLLQWLDAVLKSSKLPDEIVIAISGDSYNADNIEKAKKRLDGLVPLTIVYCDHKGMGHARNKAVENASSDWIMHLNVDDIVMPNAIEDIQKTITNDFDVIIGDMEWVGHARKSGVRKYNLTLKDLFSGRTNDHAAYRKSVWEKSKYIEYSGDVDVAFWIGLAQLNIRIGYTNTLLTRHFFRSDTVFGRYSKEDIREIKRMTEVWKKEGVHSERFNSNEYQIKGDYGFSHVTNTTNNELSIIIPFRADKGIRDKHLQWTVAHYRKMFPDAEIIIEKDTSKDIGWGTFNKSRLINKGVAKSHGRVLFITDIDMVFVKNKILSAVEQSDKHSIIFPFDIIRYVSKLSTEKILKSTVSDSFPRLNVDKEILTDKKRTERQPGGSYVITRENYDKVGGHDERFIGWGSEDSAFIKAATTMIDKPFLRLIGSALHLWHPNEDNRFEKRDLSIKTEIMQQYNAALDDKTLMSDIIREHLRVRED